MWSFKHQYSNQPRQEGGCTPTVLDTSSARSTFLLTVMKIQKHLHIGLRLQRSTLLDLNTSSLLVPNYIGSQMAALLLLERNIAAQCAGFNFIAEDDGTDLLEYHIDTSSNTRSNLLCFPFGANLLSVQKPFDSTCDALKLPLNNLLYFFHDLGSHFSQWMRELVVP